jgi:hypothetical protein
MSTQKSGRTGKACYKFETTWATAVTPDRAMRLLSEGVKLEINKGADDSLIAEILSTQRTKLAELCQGPIDLKTHPEELGPIAYWALGTQSAASDPADAIIIVSYTGSENYARVTKSGTDMTFETSSDGSSWSVDTNVGVAGVIDLTAAAYDTASELATYLDGLSDYHSDYIGYDDADTSNIADFTATETRSNAQFRQALILNCVVASTTAKLHTITPLDATGTLPSCTVMFDRNLGTDESVRYVGTKIASFTMAVSAADFASTSLTVTAKDEDTGQTYPAITIPDDKAYVAAKICMWINGVKMGTVKDFSLALNSNLTADNVLCSYNIIEQIRQNAELTISGNMNLDTTSGTGNWQFRPEYINDREVEIIIGMESTEYADSTNNVLFSSVIRLNKVDLDDFNTNLAGPGVMTVPFSGLVVNSDDYDHIVWQIVDDNTTTYA